jgi:hypothetical protein
VKEVRTEIEINAGPEEVWKILTDFDKYDQWNPFIKRIIGNAIKGSKIEIHLQTPRGKNRKYRPMVTKVEQDRELRWLGKNLLLNGEHVFTIEQLQPGRVRLVHRELFDGLLTSIFGKSLDTDVKQGFEEMNRALKERAERTVL